MLAIMRNRSSVLIPTETQPLAPEPFHVQNQADWLVLNVPVRLQTRNYTRRKNAPLWLRNSNILQPPPTPPHQSAPHPLKRASAGGIEGGSAAVKSLSVVSPWISFILVSENGQMSNNNTARPSSHHCVDGIQTTNTNVNKGGSIT